jgi:TPR repeat protein
MSPGARNKVEGFRRVSLKHWSPTWRAHTGKINLVRIILDRVGAELGDAFAQAWMARRTSCKESFQWAEKSAAQGERDGFYQLGYCYQHGFGACLRDGTACEQDPERAKENFLVAAELGDVQAMVHFGCFFDKDDSQRFVWFGRAARNGGSVTFWNETSYQIRNFKFRKCRFRNWASSERTY